MPLTRESIEHMFQKRIQNSRDALCKGILHYHKTNAHSHGNLGFPQNKRPLKVRSDKICNRNKNKNICWYSVLNLSKQA